MNTPSERFPPQEPGTRMNMLRLSLVVVVGLAIGLAGLAFDLYFPLGVAGGVPYMALVLVGLASRQSVMVLFLAAVGSILTVAGYYLSPPGEIHDVVFINRGLALFAIWATAIVSYVHLRALARLEPLAHTDSLTGLSNRYALEQEVTSQIERLQRYGEPVSLILFDLDHFKQINDTCGHPAGDHVLQAIARLCLYQSRRIDTVARIGGEEFAILLPNTYLAGALETAKRLRRAIEQHTFQHEGNMNIEVTASFGVAELGNDDRSLKDLLMSADQALYKAKERGRNRVVGADSVANR